MALNAQAAQYFQNIAQNISQQPISGEQFSAIAERVKKLPQNTPLNQRSFDAVVAELKLAPHHAAAVAMAILFHKHGPALKEALFLGGPADAIQYLLRQKAKPEIEGALQAFYVQMQASPEAFGTTWELPIGLGRAAFREEGGRLEFYNPGVPESFQLKRGKEGELLLEFPPPEGQDKPVQRPIREFNTATLGGLYDLLRTYISQQAPAEKALAAGGKLLDEPLEVMRELGQILTDKQGRRNQALAKAEEDLRLALKGMAVGKVDREAMEALRKTLGL